MTAFHAPHIDGLRGIAVLAILLFHLGVPGAQGGFLGVDIFFVISGYLITGQISRQLKQHQFSLPNFYLRRARRLLPALFVTLMMTLIAGFLLLSPNDLSLLAKSVLATEFFYSNVYFWMTSGYFSDISQSNILLHTWSLALEEQFYLIWPLLVVGLLKGLPTAGLKWTMLSLLIASTIASSWAAFRVPEAAFYLLPFRFHEFLIGGLAYLVGATQAHRLNRIGSLGMTTAGAILLLGSFITINENTAFPGLTSLAPTVGTALLLLSSPMGPSRIILMSTPLRQIGLASYSIYLVHWPLIAFTQKLTEVPSGVTTGLTLFTASIILGYASYRLVESPFRNRYTALYQPKIFLPLALTSFLLLTAVTAVTVSQRGFPERFVLAPQMTQEDLRAQRERYWAEFGSNNESKLQINNSPEYVLVVGNSHAQDLIYALRQNDFQGNFKTHFTSFKCFNFGVGTEKADDPMCSAAREQLLRSELLKGAAKIYLHEDFNGEWISDLVTFFSRLRTVTKAPIYLFGPRLTFKRSVLGIALDHGSSLGLSQYARTQSFLTERKELNSKFQGAFEAFDLAGHDIFYVDTLRTQCGKNYDECGILSPKTRDFLYFDNSHFTKLGAREFGAALKITRPDIYPAP